MIAKEQVRLAPCNIQPLPEGPIPPQGAANTSLKFGPQAGESFSAGEQRHRSTLYLSLASFNFFRPSVFNIWFNVKTGDELLHQASSLDSRQAKHFGLKFFNGGGHVFLPIESSYGRRVP